MRKNKGYSFVLVIIFAVVLGLFLAMSMIIGYDSPPPTKAPEIISDMRNIKTAVLVWYVDNLDSVDRDGTISGKTLGELADNPEIMKQITEYLSKDSRGNFTLRGKSSSEGEYGLICGANQNEWFIVYDLSKDDDRTRKKLASRAKFIGLLSEPDKKSPPYDSSSAKIFFHIITLKGD